MYFFYFIIGTCVSPQNYEDPSLFLRLDSFAAPVIFPTEDYIDPIYQEKYKQSDFNNIPEPTRQSLLGVLALDPIEKLDAEKAALLWENRLNLLQIPHALPKVLLATRWNILDDVLEIKKLMMVWKPLSPTSALELLDANFGDLVLLYFLLIEYFRMYAN